MRACEAPKASKKMKARKLRKKMKARKLRRKMKALRSKGTKAPRHVFSTLNCILIRL